MMVGVCGIYRITHAILYIVLKLQPLEIFSVVFCLTKMGEFMRGIVLFLCLFFPTTIFADIPSTAYVNGAVSTRVDTSESANQTMAGTYNVSGTMTVPTPPLPVVE